MKMEGHGPGYGGSYGMSNRDLIVYVLFIVGGIVVVYLILKDAVSSTVSGVKDTVNSIIPVVPNPISPDSPSQTSASTAVLSGANSRNTGQGPLLTKQDYDNFLSGAGWPVETVVRVGNTITPPVLLEAAARAGAESAETVNRLGLNDAYVDLSAPAKGLVTLGQGIGKAAGVDIIQMGYDFRTTISQARQGNNGGV